MAGLILSVINIPFSVSLSAYIFSGPNSSYIPMGAGLILVSCALISAVIALGSSLKGMIAAPQSIIISVVAMMAASLTSTVMDSGQTGQIIPTIVTAIMLTSILTGITMLLIGRFKLGELIRYIPYPVIGGQIAGAGFFLIKGSVPVVTDISMGLENLNLFLDRQFILSLAPAFIAAVALLFLNRRFKSHLVMPAAILLGIIIFYIYLEVFHITVQDAIGRGWLIPEINTRVLWSPKSILLFNQAHWPALSGEAGSILSIIFITVVTFLIKASGIEMITRKDIDLNHDLKITGTANVLAGLAGGTIGFNSTTGTIFADKINADNRMSGLFHAFFCILALFLGTYFISYLPKYVIGGITMFLGMSFLVEWIYDSWFKLPKTDYFIVVIILLVAVVGGFLTSIAVGIIIASIFFIINYSLFNVIKYELTGKSQRSKVDRQPEQEKILETRGMEIYSLILQGFLFFGSVNKILARIRESLAKSENKIHYIILDFQNVSNIDTSAVNCFLKILNLSKKENFTIINTHLNNSIQRQLKHFGYFSDQAGACLVFSNYDRGLEWCEDQMLEAEKAIEVKNFSMAEHLDDLFQNQACSHQLIDFLEKRTYKKGDYVFREGEIPDGLYFIESGEVSIVSSKGKRKKEEIRFRLMKGGGLFGEMGLYSGEPRTANALVERESELYFLSNESFKRLHMERPELAIEFHQCVVRLLSERLKNNIGFIPDHVIS